MCVDHATGKVKQKCNQNQLGSVKIRKVVNSKYIRQNQNLKQCHAKNVEQTKGQVLLKRQHFKHIKDNTGRLCETHKIPQRVL